MAKALVDRVGIVGAGLGGLTLANALVKRGVEVAVFEKDASMEAREQGYAIALTEGLDSVVRIGVPVDHLKRKGPGLFSYLRLEGGACKAIMKMDMGESSPNPMHQINRAGLRQALLKELPEGVVRWGCPLEDIEEAEDAVTLKFSGGHPSETFPLVVGADGVNSAVRRKLVGETPKVETNVIGVSGRIKAPSEGAHVIFGSAVGGFIVDGEYSFFTKQFSIDPECQDVQFTWGFKTDDAGREAWKGKNRRDALEEVVKMVREAGFPEILCDLTLAAEDDTLHIRGYDDRDPLEAESIPKGRLILMGDALHCMTPFRGRGANSALTDAEDLGKAIFNEPAPSLVYVHPMALQYGAPQPEPVDPKLESVPDLVHYFHKTSTERTKKPVLQSREMASFTHSKDVLQFDKVCTAFGIPPFPGREQQMGYEA